jgi:hypothetical protein
MVSLNSRLSAWQAAKFFWKLEKFSLSSVKPQPSDRAEDNFALLRLSELVVIWLYSS